MSRKKRDTYKYEWKKGNKTLSYGITNDLERRESEHQREVPGSHLRNIGNASSEDGARDWEKTRNETYLRQHGKLPPKAKQK